MNVNCAFAEAATIQRAKNKDLIFIIFFRKYIE